MRPWSVALQGNQLTGPQRPAHLRCVPCACRIRPRAWFPQVPWQPCMPTKRESERAQSHRCANSDEHNTMMLNTLTVAITVAESKRRACPHTRSRQATTAPHRGDATLLRWQRDAHSALLMQACASKMNTRRSLTNVQRSRTRKGHASRTDTPCAVLCTMCTGNQHTQDIIRHTSSTRARHWHHSIAHTSAPSRIHRKRSAADVALKPCCARPRLHTRAHRDLHTSKAHLLVHARVLGSGSIARMCTYSAETRTAHTSWHARCATADATARTGRLRAHLPPPYSRA
jgi:hypothetical protein